MLPHVVELFRSGKWALNYATTIHGTGSVFSYGNSFEWLATQISGYTALLAIILAFLYMRQKEHRKIAYVTILVYIISSMLTASYVSSRSMIFQIGFRLLILYLFVSSELDRCQKFFIKVIAIGAGAVAVFFLISVTVSRFAGPDSYASLIRYMGQAPINFNQGLEKIPYYSHGGYTLGYFFGGADMDAAVAAWNNGFYTFVGWMYIDWGPIGVILIGLVMYLLFDKLIRKKQYQVSDLLLIFYYCNFLIIGSLVIGPDQILSIVMMLVLYIILKVFIENRHNLMRIKDINVAEELLEIAFGDNK